MWYFCGTMLMVVTLYTARAASWLLVQSSRSAAEPNTFIGPDTVHPLQDVTVSPCSFTSESSPEVICGLIYIIFAALLNPCSQSIPAKHESFGLRFSLAISVPFFLCSCLSVLAWSPVMLLKGFNSPLKEPKYEAAVSVLQTFSCRLGSKLKTFIL